MTDRSELRQSFFLRLASTGFVLVFLSVVVAAVTGNATGIFAAIPPLVLVALVLAILLRWGRGVVAGLVAAVLLVLAYVVLQILGGFFELRHPDSFPDFVPALMRFAGSLMALAGLVTVIRQRRTGSLRPIGPAERRIQLAGLAALMLVAALSAVLTYSGRSEAGAPPGSQLVLTEDDSFDPSELQAEAGEVMRVFVSNRDSYAHTITIDELALDEYLGPRAERLVTIRIPDAAGRIEFYCAVTGHEGMDGRLVVSS